MTGHRLKRLILNLAKLGFAAALIYWLIHSKKITLEPFVQLANSWWPIPLALGSTALMLFVNNYRWLLLLHGQGIPISQWKTLRLSFIGLFFNLAMPGSVGGDVLKAYYITREYPHAKLKVATSVLVDRLVGLYSIILLAFIAIVSNLPKVTGEPALRNLGIFIFLLFGAFNLFFLIGFSRRIRGHDFTENVLKKLPAGGKVAKIYDGVHSFRDGQKQFLIGIALSLFAQSQMITSLFIIGRHLGFEVSFESFFFVFPVGFMAIAIPISPAGIGVGQAVFLKLFHWYNGVETAMGPTLITINQVCLAILGLMGAGFYFTHKARHHE